MTIEQLNSRPHQGYNCGGYALETYEWFYPASDYYMENNEIYDFETEMLNVIKIAFEIDVDDLIESFNLQLIDSPDDYPPEIDVIAFREGYCEVDDEFDLDFHFKIRKNGIWSEKQGSKDIRECLLLPDENWLEQGRFVTLNYIGEIAYFIKE